MIGKELLSEVLGRYVVEFKNESWLKSNNTIVYTLKDEESEDFINIYEFAHKCKEWAYANKFKLKSGIYTTNGGENFGGYETNVYHCNKFGSKEFSADTEPEAIFKACQWILDNKEIK